MKIYVIMNGELPQRVFANRKIAKDITDDIRLEWIDNYMLCHPEMSRYDVIELCKIRVVPAIIEDGGVI